MLSDTRPTQPAARGPHRRAADAGDLERAIWQAADAKGAGPAPLGVLTAGAGVARRGCSATLRWARASLLCVTWSLGCGAAGAQPAAAPSAEPRLAADAPLADPRREGPVSLPMILAYADQEAPVLLIARERLRLGDAAEAAARPWLPENPRLSVGAGVRRIAGESQPDWSASLTQTVDVSGKRGTRLDAAERTQQRLRAELEEARWEVHRDVHAAFHRALVARERLQAAARLSEFQRRLLDIAQRRLRAGDVSPLVVRLAEGESSQAEVAELAAEQDYLQTRLRLAAVAGWPASHPPTPAGELDEPHEPPPSDVLLARAARHQPRLRTLRAMRAELEAQARAAERAAWPEPTIGVEVGQEGAPAGTQETVILGTLGIGLPLVQRNQGERARSAAESAVVGARERAFSLQLRHRIEQHRTAVANAAARVRAYGREILPRFEENLRLLQRAYELGEIDILQVSVARERFLRIRMDALDAYGDYFRAVADLEASIGVDLWPDEHQRHAAAPSEAGAR